MYRDRLQISRGVCAILTKPLEQYNVVATPLSPPVQELIDMVDRAVDEAIPEGSVVVDRARFERLREYVEADRAYLSIPSGVAHEKARFAAVIRSNNAREAIQPADLDPLP